MYFSMFESRNEYGCDPVGNNVVYAHANVYELYILIEAKSSMTILLSLANGINLATRQKDNYKRESTSLDITK